MMFKCPEKMEKCSYHTLNHGPHTQLECRKGYKAEEYLMKFDIPKKMEKCTHTRGEHKQLECPKSYEAELRYQRYMMMLEFPEKVDKQECRGRQLEGSKANEAKDYKMMFEFPEKGAKASPVADGVVET